jgi:peptidoglycan/xylan/chitin deacetylase (PgdA/CDA1 family)/acetyl esterase/lipase
VKKRLTHVAVIFAMVVGLVTLPYIAPRLLGVFFPGILFRFPAGERTIYLTIDDSPTEGTPAILEVLKRHDVRATFFVVSGRIGVAEQIDAIVADGHSLGHHMVSTRAGWRLTHEEFVRDFDECAAALERFGGARFFRPPSGYIGDKDLAYVRSNGLLPVLGTAYPFDASIENEGLLVRLTSWLCVDGGIIILHDGRDRGARTAVVLDRLIPLLKSKGYSVRDLNAARPFSALAASDGRVVHLWPDVAPGSKAAAGDEVVRLSGEGERIVTNVHRPSLTVYLPDATQATGAAVLVIPGGGHRELWMDHEGFRIAQWLSERGIAAFVLKYRLARQEGSNYTVEGHSLADAQRALRLIRHRASEWQVDPERLGVMGFSAGGHIAALTALRAGAGQSDPEDPVEGESCRPSFQALIYPAFTSLIVPTKDSPPAYLLCGENDRADFSLGLAQAFVRFREAGVSAELHILAGAGHGFGLRASNSGATKRWIEGFCDWLEGQGWLAAESER